MNGERKLALFIDFENIARGVKEAKLVLERLLEKGKIIVRRAYADWNRFTEYKRPFHESAIELIDALVSGDSDFSPLVSKLRENDRYVIGLGVRSSSSDLLAAKQRIVTLERDEKSGTYVITSLTEEGGRAA